MSTASTLSVSATGTAPLLRPIARTGLGLDRDVLLVASVVVLGSIMSILDVTVVNVAIGTLAHDFGTTLPTIQWVTTGYTLALATVIPLTGWGANRFGTKRLYIGSTALFVLGSLLSGLAWNAAWLIGFRVLQGLGGGVTTPLGMTILTRAAGPHRVGRVMAVIGVPMLLGPVLGPVLGGWLVESLSWRWIFMINVPIGVAAVVLARRVLPPDVPEPHHGLDWRGLALLSPGLAMFIYGLAQSNSVGGLTAPRALVPAGLGLVALALFVGHALRVEEPLIDLRLFADRTFSASAATMLLMVISVFGGMLLLPLYLQTVRGESPMSTGLLLAPQGLGAMLAMPIASRLSDTTGVGRIVPAGLTMIAAAFLGLTQLTATTSYWVFGGVVFLLGAGMGATTMPIFSGALRTLRREGIAQASTTLNIVQQTAAACGAALLSVLLVQAIAAGAPPTGGVPPAAAAAQLPRVAETALATALGGSSVPPYEPSAPQLASAFATTFWWALAMVLIATAVAVALLPKGPPQSRDDGEPREGG